jgi:protease II
VASESKETSEVSYIPRASPAATPVVVRTREHGVLYEVDSHAPSRSLLLISNVDGAFNRKLMVASLDAPSDWRPLLKPTGDEPVLSHSVSRSIDRLLVFDAFAAVQQPPFELRV